MVTSLKKIYLIASSTVREEILNFLHNFGRIQVIDLSKEKKEEIVDLNYEIVKVKFSLDFLKNFQRKKGGNLKEKLNKTFSPKIEVNIKELEEITSFFNWKKITKETEEGEVNLNETIGQIKKIQEEIEKIYPWRELDLDLNEFKKTKNISFFSGYISKDSWPNLLEDLAGKIKLVEAKRVGEKEKKIYCLIIFTKEVEKELEKILEENHFEKTDLSFLETSPKKHFANLEEKLKIFELKLKELEKKIYHLTDDYEKLKIIFDWLSWQKEKEETKQKVLKTSFTFSILSWIERKAIPLLKEGIAKITQEFEIVEVPLKKDEVVPVLLKNKEFVSDFETITNIYGAPKYNEPDPTPFLTPFFILFFAICLSDAGYGLVLGLLAFFIVKFLDLPKRTKKFFRLFLWLGIMTFFIGATFGSWFGIELETMPEFLKPVREFLIKLRIIDPVKNPLQLLIIALILGVFQILVGLTIRMYWKIKNKETLDGILDCLPWIILISSILIFISASSKVIPLSLDIIKYFVFTGVGAIVLTQGRHQKNIFLKIGAGVLSLYNIIGYLSDTLSYSRLLALGLATSIIGMVINLLAKIFAQMIPGLGFLVAILILIFGHLFNLGINTLGAFIHSSRLQFVEFFPKFIEGGGTKFHPFQKEGKYIRLISQ